MYKNVTVRVAVSEHVLSFHHVGSETELGFSGLVPLHTEASRQFKGFLKNKTTNPHLFYPEDALVCHSMHA